MAELKITEDSLQQTVVDAAWIGGWRVAHWATARTKESWRTPCRYDGKGFPDLILSRDRVIFAELKSSTGRMSVDQTEWLRALTAAGMDARVIWPGNLDALTTELLTPPPKGWRR